MLVTNYDDPNFKNGRPVMTDTVNSDYIRSDVHSSTAGDTLSRRSVRKCEIQNTQCVIKLSKLEVS